MKGIALFLKEKKKMLITFLIVLFICFLYYLMVTLTPLYIPCVFHLVTGLACPGCGVSTLLVKLSRLDIMGAISENYCIALLIPVWLISFIVYAAGYPRLLRNNSKGLNIIAWGSIILLIIFGIVRNIPGFELLLPTAMR